MKKLLLLSAMLIPSAFFANGLTVNVGGGLNHMTLTPNSYFGSSLKTESTGGGYNVEIGYLWQTSTGKVIQAVDSRLGFAQDFNNVKTFLGSSDNVSLQGFDSWRFDTINLYIGAVYNLGAKVGNGTLLVDVLGFNFGWMKACEKRSVGSESMNFNMGNSFQLGLVLPAGVKYVFDMGLMIGFRQKLDFAFGGAPTYDAVYNITGGSSFGTRSDQFSYLAYNLALSIGYKFNI